ncbi:hypothetical protein [Chryseobacterium sp. FH1]|uniref:hypothetical protein n=1 Tax=Chryseobacterium sp. FH1 TaxID=1233951 RepID=UPI0004E30837|nr:hypothetical protein [Chryseobacterium sp. FH1]KFC19345.1 hypothetical protein IO90_08540 [Chryseobacterium sp. FH1]
MDPIKNNALGTTFSGTKKIPVTLLASKDYGFINFHIALADYEIVGAHLLKSDEWIYGLYFGANYYGYLYLGEKLTLEQQMNCIRDYLPKDRNELTNFKVLYNKRIDYYESTADSFVIAGEINNRKVIVKSK